MDNQDAILKKIFESVLNGDVSAAKELAEESLEAMVPPMMTLQKGLTPGIKEVGDRFGRGEVYLPEMVLAADAMEAAVTVLTPHLGAEDLAKKATIIIGSAKGDIHDIGKNIASALLAVNGFNVVDIGRDVSPETFIDQAEAHKADIVGLSSLLTTSMPYLEETIEMMEAEGVRKNYKVIIGGGPTNQPFADKIGADGYAATAADGVDLCDRLIDLPA
jgi:corrinoid protein of di/trimethylamine methyltransferase